MRLRTMALVGSFSSSFWYSCSASMKLPSSSKYMPCGRRGMGEEVVFGCGKGGGGVGGRDAWWWCGVERRRPTSSLFARV